MLCAFRCPDSAGAVLCDNLCDQCMVVMLEQWIWEPDSTMMTQELALLVCCITGVEDK